MAYIGYKAACMFARTPICTILLIVLLSAGCRSKKKISLAGDEPVQVSEFISFFEPLKLTFEASDSILLDKYNDSLRISQANFSSFVPDSILQSIYTKSAKPKLYAIGKAVEKDKVTYLFVESNSASKKALLILAFDKKENFIAALLAIVLPGKKGESHKIEMSRNFTITRYNYTKNPDGTPGEIKEVFALNEAGKTFNLIMTDAPDIKYAELINPIDTLPQTHQYAADYSNGKMNLVSVRDGRKDDRISFFIHFEKNNGECIGELKGEAFWRKPNMAEYRENGDPCVLQFIFSKTAVTLKEVDGCGSRRGLECSFNGSFAKKKKPAPKK
ncbi:MAG TPA: hypothetical protein PLU37_08760 [Chitinophagaceae bacterium]|nr:hypothetical protein [Chitinophagaceae bacterium]HRX93328.1 hypothetical protein [Chitinophagaceae bacterium]